MEKVTKKQYGNIVLADIIADRPAEWDISDATHVRVSLPSGIKHMSAMQQRGYQFADRMLDVTIGLKKVSPDLKKSVRMQPVLVSGHKEEIKELAAKSFATDRRFHVELEYCPEIAKQIIGGWVDEIPEFYVCLYKESIIGFLALKEAEDGKSASIHLAAVEERYRTSGAAMSLYANAVQVGAEKGYQSITGCISSCNMAVMNLYAYLGAAFSSPRDIYLRGRQAAERE